MPIYEVTLSKISKARFTITAKNEQIAEEKAYNGEYDSVLEGEYWFPSDWETDDIREVEE